MSKHLLRIALTDTDHRNLVTLNPQDQIVPWGTRHHKRPKNYPQRHIYQRDIYLRRD